MSLEQKFFYRKVFALVFPMALQNLINVGVTTADVVMLGRVNETVLSAASLAGQVQFILSLLFFGLSSGATVLASQYWGKQDLRTIEKIMGITLRFALAGSILVSSITLLFPEQVMRIFSSEADVIAAGASYLRIVALGYVISGITMIYVSILRSIEKVIFATVMYSVSLLINVVLNSILIFGLLGFPAMGIKGAAIATLIARICELFLVILYSKLVNRSIAFHLKDLLVLDPILNKDYLRYCTPVMINEIIWGTGTSACSAIIGHLGKSAVAANSVAQVTRQLAMIVCFGIANATAIMLGKELGEGKTQLAKQHAKSFIRITMGIALMGSVVILLASQVTGRFLVLSSEAKTYLLFMMFVMSYFALAQAFNTTVIVGVLRSGGDTRYGLFIDTITMWAISLPLGFLAAFVFHLPVPIVYMILLSDEIFKLPLSYFRYRKQVWVKDVTRNS